MRVTVNQTVKVLAPVGAFVICQHAFLFLELWDLRASDLWVTLSICSAASMFFLIYAYAIVINGKACDLYLVRNPEIARVVDEEFELELSEL